MYKRQKYNDLRDALEKLQLNDASLFFEPETSIALEMCIRDRAYMDGDIEIEGDLYDALDHFLGQMYRFSTDQSALRKLIFTSTGKKNQAKEVQSHYDIGNDFYKLWLDETMSYSCGYFLREDDTLYDAQVNKVDRILKKLYLSEGMSLLDIGCGWGFLLLEAAKKYGVRGMGITLSKEPVSYTHLKGKAIEWPRVESSDKIRVIGSARPREDAARIAYGSLVDWMVEDYGFDKLDAYMLIGQAGGLYVGNMVDSLYSLCASIEKKYLIHR